MKKDSICMKLLKVSNSAIYRDALRTGRIDTCTLSRELLLGALFFSGLCIGVLVLVISAAVIIALPIAFLYNLALGNTGEVVVLWVPALIAIAFLLLLTFRWRRGERKKTCRNLEIED